MNADKNNFEPHGPDGPFDDRTGNKMANNGPSDGPDAGHDGGDADGMTREHTGERAREAEEPGTATGATGGAVKESGVGTEKSGGTQGKSGGTEKRAGAEDADEPGGAGDALDLGALLKATTPGDATDELALRRLFHGAVDELAPSEGALDHLRKAVPARRARKRQALIGVAAAALLLGTAIPAFVHVSNPSGGDKTGPVAIGNDNIQGGPGTEAEKQKEREKKAKEKAAGASGAPSGKPQKPKDREEKDRPSESPGTRPGKDTGGGGSTGGGDTPTGPPDEAPADALVCDAARLSVAVQEAGLPDAEGKVYGVFRVSNVSGDACSVGGGAVGVQTLGAADPAKVSVVRHTADGPATGLPDPSLEADSLLLEPTQSYEVRFAWVPSETCPTTDGGESPAPTPTDDGTGATEGTGGTTPGEVSAQLLTEDGGLQDGSISVTHVADPGAPTAQAAIPNACAGTVYQTGLLSAG
ncbi:hypothetical protein GCM10010387_02090 [Streptomyces inusitatus]|uniref:DUF4232 domain-containing protein n=1 Tax=Streptomyces inusitatus TaxID=68221 RepID=A0A918PK20_9ACTN|nr:hypothetical protein [Streptomyces inusitatus]GGZ13638.1 hypothetical protein GCM10010387_02090 [Streptomyces inusitatus]